MERHVLLLGGHGKISLLLTPLLLQRSWAVTSVIRSSSQESDILSAASSYASSLSIKVRDLESVTSQADAQAVLDETKPDYVVFSAGAGGKPPRSRTYTIDRDACIHFMNAAASTSSVTKFLLVSYIGSRRSRAPWWTEHEWESAQEINNGVLKDYHIAKLAADEALVQAGKRRGQGWTGWCLRPGGLSDNNEGGVKLGKIEARGQIGRGKVAEVAAALLERDGKGGWVDCLDGERRVSDEVERVIKEARPSARRFTASARQNQESPNGGPFRTRLRAALRRTKVEWKPIPVALGIGFLGGLQFYRVQQREKRRKEEEEEEARLVQEEYEQHEESKGRPKKRKRIRPSGPWQVQVMSTLPLKGISRLWGRFNELEIPYYLRVPGFKLYSWVFGVNLSEVSETDLHNYPNLASFFYRNLKPGVRPIDPSAALVSPADGRVLQMGTIEHGEVEQVKGMTYTLEALLGAESPELSQRKNPASGPTTEEKGSTKHSVPKDGDEDIIKADEEFAKVNGISYTLPNLFSGLKNQPDSPTMDVSTTSKSSSEAEVRVDLALGDGRSKSWFTPEAKKSPNALYYIVVYLAPGDYHRFHSPTSWVVEKRRHFAGELYSVSPYLQRTLPGLFTLNERVVLLGRWRWGFFSFTPVGATNVGSIKINFDRELRTNSLTTDTAADRAAEEAAERGEPYSGYAEATYTEASRLLGGHALRRGEEMGGFALGSSIVMVFEAPKGARKSLDEGWEEGSRKGGWRWGVEKGQRVKYGEAIGWVEE